jgi:hypothetical protein
MLSRRLLLLSTALGAVGAALPLRAGTANASTFRALSVEQLAVASRACVIGRALQSESHWVLTRGKRVIVTDTRLAVEERVAGDLEDAEIIVRTLGGQVGDIGQIAHGEAVFTREGRGLLFLSGAAATPVLRITAMAQGHYPMAERDGVRRLRASPHLGKLVGADATSATARLDQRELSAARTLVQKAWTSR